MAGNIRRQQAIYDIRNAATKLLDAARDLRALKSEYTKAGLLAQWQANPGDFTEHGFTQPTLSAALDDFATLDITLQTLDTNWDKVRT